MKRALWYQMAVTVLFVCGLAAPAMGSSVFASVVSSTACGNTTNTSTTQASVFVGANPGPGPLICPNGNGIFSGADASAMGDMSALAETVSQGGSSTITGPFSVTSTATLSDTLTFYCASCLPGTLTGNLVATMTGAVFSELGGNGVEYASYTSTITDTVTSAQFVGTGELCPTLAQSASCTAAETNPSTGYTVSNSFTIVPSDAYTLQITMISFVSVLSGDTGEQDVLATQKDPLNLILPAGVGFNSQSGDFLAPEPGSWGLVGGGLALCFGLFRRRMAR